MKLPSLQFYPGDWMKDPSLRSCSLEARGLWMDIICLMFESPIRGELRHANGNPITEIQLSRICGADVLLIQKITTELSDAGVYSKSEDGALICRRMVRDEEIRKIRAEAGKSGGNPALLKQKASKDEAKSEQVAKQNTTPSSSFSSSSSELKEKESPNGDCKKSEKLTLLVSDLVALGIPEQTAKEYLHHRKAKKSPLTTRAWQSIAAEITKLGWQLEQGLSYAMSRGWTGFESSWVIKNNDHRNPPKFDPLAYVNGNKQGAENGRVIDLQAE